MNFRSIFHIVIIISLISSYSCTLTSNADGISITQYDIQTTLSSLHDNYLFVQLTCDLVKSDTGLSYVLLFNSGTKINSISYQDSTSANITYHFKGTDSMLIVLPPQARYKYSFKLQFNYAFPISMSDSSILMLDRGHRWYPLIADCIAKVNLTAMVPKGCEVLSTGDLIAKKTDKGTSTYVWESDMPVFKIPLIVFRSDLYKQTSALVNDKEIILYTLAQFENNNDSLVSEAGNVFKFCTENIGQYPFKRLVLLEFPEFEGMNIGSGIVEIGSSYIDMMKHGYFDGLRLSIAQQWMGAGIFAKFGEPGFWFLSLSLPHYIRLMYERQSSGEEAYNADMQGQLDKYKEFAGKENDVPILDVDYPNTKEKGLVLYAKGPYVFSLLHKQMGDDRWFSFLKLLYIDFQGKILTYDSFRELLYHFDEGSTIPLLDKLVKEKGLPE